MAAKMGTMGVLLMLTVSAAGATADTGAIARWVDADGVTHFANRQFAPPDADMIEVGRANGMDAPATGGATRSVGGPQWTKLTLPPKQNRKGWRSRGESLYTGRKHQSNRRQLPR